MKFATRMVLIPETEYLLLKQSTPQSVKKKKMSRNPEAAAIDITQQLGKKMRKREQEIPKSTRPTVDVVDHISAQYQPKAKLLLAELANANIKHTASKELVLSSGEVISHSNIVDIIKTAIIPSKRTDTPKPTGWMDFIQDVATSTVPKTVFSMRTRREIEQAGPRWEDY